MVFDYIRCQMPLPTDPPPPDCEWFQSHDLPAAYIERYTITADGVLIHQEVPRTLVKDEKAPAGFWMKPVPGAARDIAIDFHGDIEMFKWDSERRLSWTYIARFTEGRCVRVWLKVAIHERLPKGLARSQDPAAARRQSGDGHGTD